MIVPRTLLRNNGLNIQQKVGAPSPTPPPSTRAEKHQRGTSGRLACDRLGRDGRGCRRGSPTDDVAVTRDSRESLLLVRRLLVAAEGGLVIPQDVCDWLVPALRGYLSEPGADLGEALGLRARPGRPNEQPHRAESIDRRDRTLRALNDWCCPGETPWQAAVTISGWLAVHRPGVSRRGAETLPHLADDLLGLVHSYGAPIPRRPRHILRILQGKH